MAVARWAVTDGPELPRRTVWRPRYAWNPTRRTAPTLGQRIDRRSRWSIQARTASARMSRPRIAATPRWIHSSQAFVSPSSGRTRP